MRHIVYAAETGKTVATTPASHLFTGHVISRLEGAGRHVAELVYDDLACADCGAEHGVALNRHADGSLVPLCESCHAA